MQILSQNTQQNNNISISYNNCANNFIYSDLALYQKDLHDISFNLDKYLFGQNEVLPEDQEKLLQKSLANEAIYSCVLDGFEIEEKVARQIIRGVRTARTKDQKQLLKLYLVLKNIDNYLGRLDLNLLDKIVFDICGDIRFSFKNNHFIEFYNDLSRQNFIHPIIKATIINFYFDYLNSLGSSNSRVSRFLFYLYLANNGYKKLQFITISRSMCSYLKYFNEAKECKNLTKFIEYFFRKIGKSIADLQFEVIKEQKVNKEVEKNLKYYKNLNKRQIEFLLELQKNPDYLMNVSSYVRLNKITKATAIKDLKELVDVGLIKEKKQGRNVFYIPDCSLQWF